MGLYSQTIIDSLGEKYCENFIFGREYREFNSNNQTIANQKSYYVLQHYIVKCLLYKRRSPNMDRYLQQMYSHFYQHPGEFIQSPLLQDSVIDLVYGQSGYRVKAFRDQYFNTNKAQKLYSKKQTEKLTEKEKEQLYSYFILNINTNNQNLKKIIQREIEMIIDSNKEIKDLTRMELLLYCHYVANFNLRYKQITPVVLIGDENTSLRGQASDSYIIINRGARDFNLPLLTKTVSHECRHIIQSQEAKTKDTKAGFEMAQMNLFSKYLDTDRYNSYHQNYRYSSIEIDAENHGYYMAELFFSILKRREKADQVRQSSKEQLSKRNYYAFMLDENNIPKPVDYFVVTNLDKIIKEHPEELNNYPVLRKMYNANGTKKSFFNLLYQRMNETIDNRGILDCYINYGIHCGELDSLNINILNINDKKKLIQALGSIYRDKILTIKDYFEDNETYRSIEGQNNTYKQIQKTTGYQMYLAKQILTFVDNNFEQLANSLGEPLSKNANNLLFDFIYDLRDFKIDSIDNEAIKNNPTVLLKIKELMLTYNKVLQKFNTKLAVQRIERLPESERNRTIVVAEKEMTIEEFIRTYAIPNMDSHQNITVGNQKMYIGSFIQSISHQPLKRDLEIMMLEQEIKDFTNKTIAL